MVSPRSLAVFGELSEDEAALFAEQAKVLVLAPGQHLFRQGEPANSLFFVVAGRIEVVAEEHGTPDLPLTTLDPGAILGEVAVLMHTPRTATARALTETRLWEMDRESFEAALESGHRWAVVLLSAIARVLAERLHLVNRRLLTMIVTEREKAEGSTGTRVAELERLRGRLLADWSF
jgi:CRP-like cAMP-binding protein